MNILKIKIDKISENINQPLNSNTQCHIYLITAILHIYTNK